MDSDLKILLEFASTRYKTVRASFAHRLDLGAMLAGLERFRRNPAIEQWVADRATRAEARPTRRGAWRVWFRRPAFHREEHYTDQTFDQLVNVSGGDGSQAWNWQPQARRPTTWRDTFATPLSRGGKTRAPFADAVPDVATWFNPVIGELLQPGGLLIAGLSAEALGTTEWAGRTATRVRGWLEGWDRRRTPGRQENLPPAEDYEFLVDSTTGVILRASSRLDGKEFSKVETIEISFDEHLPLGLFEPVPRRGRHG